MDSRTLLHRILLAAAWNLTLLVSSISLAPPATALFRGTLPPRQPLQADPFNWDQIEISTDLKAQAWRSCYEGFECAKLEVPLDWNNVTNPNKVVLAISRLPAKVDRADSSYGGPILLNPGGPGGSGVDSLVWGGKEVQRNLDGEKYFDIVSWDPRAVYRTTPSSSCFNSSLTRQLYDLKINAQGTIDVSDEVFNRKWAAVRSYGKVCEESEIGRYADGSNIRQFSTTAMVAYDMVAIIDKLEEARIRSHSEEFLSFDEASTALLQYWGFSYGTMLGNTFASMFPGRIGRVLLEGVVDAEDYVATGWTRNLQDSMKTWASFSQFCHNGKENCPLYDGDRDLEGGSSEVAIAAKVSELLERLKTDPMPASFNGAAQIVTYSDVRDYIFRTLYYPWIQFPGLASVLADLVAGNTTSMAARLSTITLDGASDGDGAGTGNGDGDILLDLPSAATNTSWDRPLPPSYAHELEASYTILCGDGNSIQSRTKAEEKAYMDLLISQSPISAGPWLEISLTCVGWPDGIRPTERSRFTGPFGSKLSDMDPRGSPILWFGNTADPVTPLQNAWRMAKVHEGSVVLVVDQPGHCSGYVNPSKCAYGVARRFFSNGVLPEEGTVCRGDYKPWQDNEIHETAGTNSGAKNL